MTRTRNLLAMMLVVLLVGSVQAQIIATDDFETSTMTDSKITGGTGFDGDWALRGKAKTDFAIVEQSLQYDNGDIKVDGGKKALQYVASDNGIALMAVRNLPTLSDSVYMSFLIESSNSTDTNDFFQIGFDAGKSTAPNLSVLLQSKFYPRSSTKTGGAPSLMAVKQGETFLLVMKAERVENTTNYDQVTLFVNPTSLDESANKSVFQNKNAGISQIKRLLIRKAFTESGDTFTVDQIRIGKTFESVVK
ncbi:MAG: hypothetical protein ACF8OB_05380 [Phycisphaeraceae bacterium JB051]